MTSPEIVPFTLAHLETYSPGSSDIVPAGAFEALEGKAVSVRRDGRTLGIFGLGVENGVGTLAAVMSDELRGMPMYLHRSAKRGLEAVVEYYGLKRVRAKASNDAASKRWLKRLGFRYKGTICGYARFER